MGWHGGTAGVVATLHLTRHASSMTNYSKVPLGVGVCDCVRRLPGYSYPGFNRHWIGNSGSTDP